GNVVIHGKRRVAANADVRHAALWINRADVHAVAFFFDLDLDFLEKFLRLAGIRILHPDGRGNFGLAPAFAADRHFAEPVVKAQALITAEGHGFLKIARDLILRRAFCKDRRDRHRQCRGDKETGAARRGETGKVLGSVTHCCFASKTSSSFSCFSWYIASSWRRRWPLAGLMPACIFKSAMALSSTCSFSR